MDDFLDVDIFRGRGDFAGDEDLAMSAANFDGDARFRVFREISIEDGVGNLVTEFVGMTGRDARRCDKLLYLGKLYEYS